MTAAAIQTDFAACLLAPEPLAPPGLRAWNGSDPGQRFLVYRNNMRSSLASALGEAFPVLRALVGEEFFRALANEYVQASPPHSPVLAEYGAGLGDFIARFPPLADWPHLADVARLEQLRVQSFHAADAHALQAPDFQRWLAQPATLPALCLRLHPSLRLLRSAYAVFSLWRAHQHDEDAERDAALATLDLGAAEDVVIWRPLSEVCVALLPAGGFECLLALQEGRPLGEALRDAAAVPGFELQTLFDRLVQHGLVADIIP